MSGYPGADHHLTVMIYDEGEIDFDVDCNAPEGARCRLICSEGCEEFTYEGHEHSLIDSGECVPLVYLQNADSICEMYEGDPRPLRSGPVTLHYHTGLGYVGWRFYEALETERGSTT